MSHSEIELVAAWRTRHPAWATCFCRLDDLLCARRPAGGARAL